MRVSSSGVADAASDPEKREQEQDRAGRHEEDANAGIARVEDDAAEKETDGKQQRRGDERRRNAIDVRRRRLRCGAESQREQHIDRAEERSVRVREAPQQPPRFVRHVEIRGHLETVQRLEPEAKRRKNEERPPPEREVATGVVVSRESHSRQSRVASRQSRVASRQSSAYSL